MSSPMPPDGSVGTMEWESRADVIYHFYSYHYFDQGVRHANSIDLINLDDADVQYYNRVADLVRGLKAHHKLAKYLTEPKPFILPSDLGNGVTVNDVNGTVFGQISIRHRLLNHVRLYNLTQEPRRRFYLLGLSASDMNFTKTIAQSKKDLENGEATKKQTDVVMATDACFGFAPAADGTDVNNEVGLAVEKFLIERQAQQVNPSAEADQF